MHSHSLQHSRRLDWVVTLRAVAALSVLAYHLWLAMGGLAVRFGLPSDFSYGLRSLFRAGYQGVDLFFVLSGFVIAWPYVMRRQTVLDRYDVVDFYQRRYFRIAPAYYCTLVVAVGLISAGLLRGTVDPAMIGAHVVFAENFHPQWVGGIRGVYWTLPTEIHFYLLFPLLLRLIDLDRPLRLAAGLLIFAIAYRAAVVWLTVEHGVWASWTTAYLPGRIDQFGCGIAAACAVAYAPSTLAVRRRTVALAGVLAVAVLVCVARNSTAAFDFWFFAGPSVSGVAIGLFVWTLGAWNRNRRVPDRAGARSGVLYAFGEASLSIYLWHTIFIDLALYAAYRYALDSPARSLLLFATVPVTLVVSLLSYRWIEAPVVARSKSPAWRGAFARLVYRASALWPRPPPRTSRLPFRPIG